MVKSHLYQNEKSVPFVPKLFNSISDTPPPPPTMTEELGALSRRLVQMKKKAEQLWVGV